MLFHGGLDAFGFDMKHISLLEVQLLSGAAVSDADFEEIRRVEVSDRVILSHMGKGFRELSAMLLDSSEYRTPLRGLHDVSREVCHHVSEMVHVHDSALDSALFDERANLRKAHQTLD